MGKSDIRDECSGCHVERFSKPTADKETGEGMLGGARGACELFR